MPISEILITLHFFKYNIGYKYLHMIKHIIISPLPGRTNSHEKVELAVKLYEEVSNVLSTIFLTVYHKYNANYKYLVFSFE